MKEILRKKTKKYKNWSKKQIQIKIKNKTTESKLTKLEIMKNYNFIEILDKNLISNYVKK